MYPLSVLEISSYFQCVVDFSVSSAADPWLRCSGFEVEFGKSMLSLG